MRTIGLKLKMKAFLLLISLFALNVALAQTCEYKITLYDQFDNSWSGGNVKVFLDGEEVLDVTLNAWGNNSTKTFSFEVYDNAEITTIYTPGTWPEENTYEIINFNGEVVYTDGAGYAAPQGIPPGVLTASCPQTGYLESHVIDYNGNNIHTAIVTSETGRIAISQGYGKYLLKYLPAGYQEIKASNGGYNSQTVTKYIPAGDTATHVFTLTKPSFVLETNELHDTLRFGEYKERSLQLSNTGNGPLQWQAQIEYEQPALFNLLFKSDISSSSGLSGLTGAESDGQHIYVTEWKTGQIAKFTADGNFTGTFEIPGVSGLRDLAYDGNYFYGGTVGNQIYVLDFSGQVLVDSIASPVKVRGIAYDEQLDAFWVCGFKPELILIDRNGQVLKKISCPEQAYGIAYDSYSAGGPYLWLYTGTTAGSNCELKQLSIEDAALTGINYNVSADMGNGLAGGLYIAPDNNNRVNLSGVHVSDTTKLFAYELHSTEKDNWLQIINGEGELAAFGGTDDLIVAYNSADWVGMQQREAVIKIATIPSMGERNITVRLDVRGGSFEVPSGLEAELTNMNTGFVSLNWTHNASAPGFDHYAIVRNGEEIETTSVNSYMDELPDYGNYQYEIKAFYNTSISAASHPALVNWSLPVVNLQPEVITTTVLEGENKITKSFLIKNDGMQGSLLSYSLTYGSLLGFIESVEPAGGILQKDEAQTVKVVYDIEGMQSGSYYQDVYVSSNDLQQPQLTVRNQLQVSEPAIISGQVIDAVTLLPLNGVTVTTGGKSTESGENGYYSLAVNEGTWDLNFEIEAYNSVFIEHISVQAGQNYTVDVQLLEKAYKPQFVHATADAGENSCILEWGYPSGSYMALYDNGSAGNYFAWELPGSVNAVKFTPAGYPAAVKGGEIYIGEGSFPEGGQVLGTSFGVAVYNDDGNNGMPGTLLDSISVMIDNFGWVSFEGLDATIAEGDFYLAMIQHSYFPNTAGIGIENNPPLAYRSYQKSYNGSWMVSSFQDFMIRAVLEGPRDTNSEKVLQMVVPGKRSKIKAKFITAANETPSAGREMPPIYKVCEGSDGIRAVENYFVTRFSGFDPEDPEDMGTGEFLTAGIDTTVYIDEGFQNLAAGYYKYGITAVYRDSVFSDTSISNIVGRLMNFDLELQVSTNDSLSSAGALIELSGLEWPREDYSGVVQANGQALIEDINCGTYILKVLKPGYQIFRDSAFYHCTTQNLAVELLKGKWNVVGLYVDPLTALATWNEPVDGIVLYEDFETEEFPPEGWMNEYMSDIGWSRTNSGSSNFWQIPPRDGYYAHVNDMRYSSANCYSCCDYLVTPPLDLSAYEDYLLVYDAFFDGYSGGSATVEYSTDGSQWDEIYQLAIETDHWREEVVDLSQWSGMNSPENLNLRFHYNDNGQFAGGWAVDNIKVAPASSRIFRNEDQLLGYELYLDSNFVATTADTFYIYTGLVYGQTYEAAVAAIYSSGSSEADRFIFTATYLPAPENLSAVAGYDTAFLEWESPQDSSGIPSNLLGYNIYRDEFNSWNDPVAFIDDPQQTTWYETGLNPRNYRYGITAVYDLEIFGYPGETDESVMTGPEDCLISYGNDLPFSENWEEANFASQQWNTGCDAWKIDSLAGNEAPSATFSGEDSLTWYNCALESYPIRGSMYPGGGIYMDFDLKVQNNVVGYDRLEIRIWSGGEWYTVWYRISMESFDWKTYRINLSEYACGYDFRIAFVASGSNSSNVEQWSLDNIHISHVCPGPYDLKAELMESPEASDVLLSWGSADTVTGYGNYLQWDNDTNFTAIGYDTTATFDVAARFGTLQLQKFDGKYLKKVSFFPAEENCDYYIRVWKGSGAAILLIDEEVFHPVINNWNTVSIPALQIDAEHELYIGYRCISQEGFPAGADEGPALTGYGDMLYNYNEGWISISEEYGMDYNWNIKGHVMHGNGKEAAVISKTEPAVVPAGIPLLERASKSKSAFSSNSRAGIEGYNILRQHENDQWQMINDQPVQKTWYVDELTTGGDYCYYVEAIVEGCSPEPSDTACISSWVGIAVNDADDLQIWPNPAKDIINISSTLPMQSIRGYNMQGVKVFDRLLSSENQIAISTESLPAGVYLLKLETAGGFTLHKLAIAER